MRTNFQNTGKAFERQIEQTVAQYQAANEMRLKKVEPPTRIIGGGAARRIIFLENPFLDLVGVWTERGGRALFVECKSTSEPKLPFDGGGVTTAQLDALRNWANAGAVVFVLWEWVGHGVKLVPVSTLKYHRDKVRSGEGFKHIKWDQLPEPISSVPTGIGYRMVDFRQTMHRLWP